MPQRILQIGKEAERILPNKYGTVELGGRLTAIALSKPQFDIGYADRNIILDIREKHKNKKI